MEHSDIIYFDNNATTPVRSEVVEAMLPFFKDSWGNPSSAYHFGNKLLKAIDNARQHVANLLGAEPREIIFTSCGTESNNTAIHSALVTQPNKRHVIMSSVEHSANIQFGRHLEKMGFRVSYLPVLSNGLLDIKTLENVIGPDTAIVSIMLANNETGVLLPIAEIAHLCRDKGVLLHSDAVQATGKIDVNVKELGVDFLSISGHKINAPKGIGALYIRGRTRFQPYLIGGQQERGRRGGTENVPYIVGFGKAAELALQQISEENNRIRRLRDLLEEGILNNIPQTWLNGDKITRLPNTSNVGFSGVESEAVLMMLDQAGICASSGSACTTGSLDPSHVLTAMGLKPIDARSSIRFSLGMHNNESQVYFVVNQMKNIVDKLRQFSPPLAVKKI